MNVLNLCEKTETVICVVGIARKGTVKPNLRGPVGAGRKVVDAERTILAMSSGVSEQSFACLLRWKLFYAPAVKKMAFFCRS